MDRKSSGAGFQERRDRPSSSEAARRKPLPPEKTHAEEFYYQKQMTSRSGVIITMGDGETVRGIIEWYDRECIKLHRDDGPNLLIYKRWIKFIGKDPATP